MIDYVKFWVAKALAEVGIAIAVVLAVFLLMLIVSIPRMYRQWRCKHDGCVSRETQACDAICAKCGKNLGFIGSWREHL